MEALHHVALTGTCSKNPVKASVVVVVQTVVRVAVGLRLDATSGNDKDSQNRPAKSVRQSES